jgi:hypothetical protein
LLLWSWGNFLDQVDSPNNATLLQHVRDLGLAWLERPLLISVKPAPWRWQLGSQGPQLVVARRNPPKQILAECFHDERFHFHALSSRSGLELLFQLRRKLNGNRHGGPFLNLWALLQEKYIRDPVAAKLACLIRRQLKTQTEAGVSRRAR